MKKFFALMILTAPIAFAAVMSGNPAPEFREYQSLGVEKIQIENTSGKITISPMAVDKIEIWATKRKFSERCNYRTEKSGFSEVFVRVERSVGEDCQVDIEMKIPKTADLNIWSGSGNVNITGMEGNLIFNVGSGSVVADGKLKKVEGKSGSGSIDLRGLTGGGFINVGSGPVTLQFLDTPTGQMDVRTGTGDANISFPKNTKINASLTSGSGDVSNELGNSESAEFGLSVKTGSGDLNVRTY